MRGRDLSGICGWASLTVGTLWLHGVTWRYVAWPTGERHLVQLPAEPPLNRTRVDMPKGFLPVPNLRSFQQKCQGAAGCWQKQGSKLAGVSVMVIRRETPNCYHCNSTQHLAKDCKFKAAKCHQCGKVVRIQKACLSKAMAQGQVPKGKKSPHPLKAHLVNDNGCQHWVAHQQVNIKLA